MAREDPAELRRRPQQQRSRATVGFVLEAAAQLFAEHGYDATTTNAVAQRTGVSIGTLYQYFPSKDGLLVGLLDQHLAAAETVLLARLRAVAPGRPDEAVRTMVQVVVEHNTGHPRLAALLHEHAARQPELRSRVGDLRRRVAEALVAHLIDPGVGPDVERSRPRLRADLCVRLVDHLVHSVLAEPPPGVALAEVIEEVVGVARRCLRDESGTGPRHR